MDIKNFLQWFGLKQKLHETTSVPPLVSQRDLWWASFGENVGSEINGKSRLFSRPAIVFKKLSHGFYLVIPTTSVKKEGSWYVHFVHQGKDMYACLHQIRVIDYRRLSTKLGKMEEADFDRVLEGFKKLYIPK